MKITMNDDMFRNYPPAEQLVMLTRNIDVPLLQAQRELLYELSRTLTSPGDRYLVNGLTEMLNEISDWIYYNVEGGED